MMEPASCVKSVVMAAKQYRLSGNEDNLINFMRQIDVSTPFLLDG